MLTLPQVKKEALRVAREYFGAGQVKDVLVEEDIDSEGKDSLRVTIVLKSVGHLTGTKLSRISIDLIDFMVCNNDDRYPYTHYATVKDLQQLTGT